MGQIASQITSLTIVCSIVYFSTDQRKYQSSVSLAFVRGIHRGPVNSPHKGPVTRKMFPFDDVIMTAASYWYGKMWHNVLYVHILNNSISCLYWNTETWTKWSTFCRQYLEIVCIVVNDIIEIVIEMSMKFISDGSIYDNSSLVQVMGSPRIINIFEMHLRRRRPVMISYSWSSWLNPGL